MEMADPALVARAGGFDATWLAERRWFRRKARGVARVELVDAARVDATPAWLLVLRAEHDDGAADRYLVPAVSEDDGQLCEPEDGDGGWRAILAAIATGGELRGEAGRFTLHATDALAELLPGGAPEASGLEERRLRVEQSNTSIRLGERLVLKIYRLLEAGANPEVEVNAFLTAAHFTHAPVMAGWITYEPDRAEAATAAMLQELVPSRGDGWQWLLNRLVDPPTGPMEALAGTAVIGGITAHLHESLASRPDVAGFEVRQAALDERRSWRRGAERQLDDALNAVSGPDRERLGAVAGKVRGRFLAMEKAGHAVTSRIHGDYHLGQLLRTESSFMVIDFEGEPARPLAERRSPASPLRDVAGMLRSLDYAARTAERDTGGTFEPEPWLADARSAFLTAYGAVPDDQHDLLAAFEAEKACYEVRYEANNRPDWTWLPIRALERIAA
jgi:maltokinase